MDFDSTDIDLAMSEIAMETQANMADPYIATFTQTSGETHHALRDAMTGDNLDDMLNDNFETNTTKTDVALNWGWGAEPDDEVISTGTIIRTTPGQLIFEMQAYDALVNFFNEGFGSTPTSGGAGNSGAENTEDEDEDDNSSSRFAFVNEEGEIEYVEWEPGETEVNTDSGDQEFLERQMENRFAEQYGYGYGDVTVEYDEHRDIYIVTVPSPSV